MKKNEESYFLHEYTLLDGSTKSMKIELGRSLKEEMKLLGITDRNIFQIQMKKIML